MTTVITRKELQQRMQTCAILVEALPEKYYRDWHLPGALHMPHDQVAQVAAKLLPNKDTDIVVYCASETCTNSHIAANLLSAMGYTRVCVYGGGKRDWSEANLPAETSAAAA